MQNRFPLLDDSLTILMTEVWTGRRYIALGAILGAVVAGMFVLFSVPRYASEMIIAPTSPLSRAMDPSAHSQDTFLLFENLVIGPSIARTLMEKYPQDIEKLHRDRFFIFFSSPLKQSARPEDVAIYLKHSINSSKIGETSLTRLTYTHPDPVFAAEFLTHLHETTDTIIRTRVKETTKARITYLEEALMRTHNEDHKRALTDLLMEQEQIAMLAAMTEAFSARIIEPSTTSPEPVWPTSLPIIFMFIILGAGGGFTLSLYRRFIRRLPHHVG